ncbi:FAD-dependent oxidoreductase [Peribacillus frigoritolerans]|uniref:FAD-dependent oxidoreductase n=2 Tax=Peribacillus frigoritolerans TaxID=450367 RepID=UPI0035127A39
MELKRVELAWAGKVYWKDAFEARKYPMFGGRPFMCVCIVGSGSSGVHGAYFLAETGLNVVLIDKRDISEGSTVANTGLLQFSNDQTLTSLIRSFGEEHGMFSFVWTPFGHLRKRLFQV